MATNKLEGRPYQQVKTGIDDLQKLQEVKQSLAPSVGADRLRQRARIRREFATTPISKPVVSPQSPLSPVSGAPYQVERYDPESDRWQVRSISNPSDQFSAVAIKSGGIAIGSIVRGYPPIAIEQKPQGREFEPVTETSTQVKRIKISIKIGYTGKQSI